MLIGFLAYDNTHTLEETSLNINDYLNEIVSFQASFKQTIYSPRNEVLDYSKGSFILKKPGKIIWNFTTPSIKKIVVEDQKITTGELHAYLFKKVQKESMQLKRLQTPQISGDTNQVLVQW